MSSDELKLAQGLLQDLNGEIEQMDQMLTEMEGIPEERRSGEAWDSFTKRFVNLQAAQRAIGEKLKIAKAALANSVDKPTKQ
jgi:uncharacterized protein (DUF305 family)